MTATAMRDVTSDKPRLCFVVEHENEEGVREEVYRFSSVVEVVVNNRSVKAVYQVRDGNGVWLESESRSVLYGVSHWRPASVV